MSVTSTASQNSQPAASAQNVLAENESVKEQTSASSESQDEITDESETSEESQTDQIDDQEGDQDDEAKQSKPKKGFKKRIAKLNQRLSVEQQEKEYWKQEALKAKRSDEPERKAQAQKETKSTEGKPDPNTFDTYDAYIDALTDWKADQRELKQKAKEQENQLKTEFQKREQAHNNRVAEFRKTKADYADVIESFLEDRGDNVQFSAALTECIYDSENGPAVIYELAKNPKEFDRINALPAFAAAREFGKIEDRLAKASEQPEIKKQTKAPPPIAPVGSKGTASLKKSLDDPGLSFKEYAAMRMEQIKRKRA